MKVKNCQNCGRSMIVSNAYRCPHCGAEQKPRFRWISYFFIALFLFGLIGAFTGGDKASSPSSHSADISEQRLTKHKSYVELLQREMDSLEDYTVDTYLDTKESIVLGASLFLTWAKIAEEGSSYTLNDNEKKILREFKKKVSIVQKNALPRLRDAYGPALRKVLWEYDMSARTIGSGFNTIEFVGGAFAANRNIKQFQLNIIDTLHLLRFKQSRYKWFKEADEYTYYSIESADDSALVVIEKYGIFREVK